MPVADAAEASRYVSETLSETMAEGTLGKQDLSPVTVGDFAVQAIVCKRLQDAFPNDPIIAEEAATELRREDRAGLLDAVVAAVRRVIPTADSQQVCDWIDRGSLREHRPRFWTLDPIDGTKGFLRRQQYAVCLALILHGAPAAAALACPNLPPTAAPAGAGAVAGVVFAARRGGGACSLPLPPGAGGEGAAAAPRTRLDLREGGGGGGGERFCESVEAGHSDHAAHGRIAAALGITSPPLRMDSQAKYGVLARGEAQVFLRLPPRAQPDYVENIWDHAAGALVLREAGGEVTDAAGRPMDFAQGPKLARNRGVVASSGPLLHGRVVAAVAAAAAEPARG